MRRKLTRNGRRGFTLLEVVLSSTVLAVALLAATAAFSSSLLSVERAKRITGATMFLSTVMEDVTAQDFDNLLALNGNTIFDGATLAASDYSVDLTTFVAGIDLVQVDAVLNDLESGREVGRVSRLRRRE